MTDDRPELAFEDPFLSLRVGLGHYEWGREGLLNFHGVRGAYFWLDPSLKRVLLPLSEEIGPDLFSLLIARSSSVGVQADYDDIILKSGAGFRNGVLFWGEAVKTAGWGQLEIPVYQPEQKRAVVVIRNAWELGLQKGLPKSKMWGCPFIQGKIQGLFSIGFETNCWADPIDYPGLGEEDIAFEVQPSERTIENSLRLLRKVKMEERERELADLVDIKTSQLQTARNALKQKTRELSVRVAQQTAEIRERNEALVQSQQKLTSILQTAPGLILNVDRTGAVHFLNKWDDLVPSRTLWDMDISSDDADKLKTALQTVFSDGVTVEVTVTIHSGEKPSEYLFILGPVVTLNEVTSATLVGTDLTERRELEEQLSHAQRMESIGLLAGGVAHDFNNILTAILGSAELIREELGPNSSVDDLLKTILDVGQKGASLVGELSVLSRKSFEAPRVLELSEVVCSLRTLLERTLPELVQTSMELSNSPLPVRIGDGQIEQVLLNLVLNAKEAMPDGGLLTISTHCVQPGDNRPSYLLESKVYAALTVSDTGIGMTADVKRKIFDPFFTTKSVGEGTGLGLATSFRIVKRAGGFWQVDSQPGKGSTFTVFLPLSEEPAEPIQEIEITPDELKGTGTILLVEDEASVRRMASRYLRSKNYSVVEACNGGEALELLKQKNGAFDMLITDIMMPVMTGLDLAREVREVLADIPILFMSGYSEMAPPDGETALLAKPFSVQELGRRVKQLLAQRC